MSNRATEIRIVIDYHKRTEHHLPDRLAASLGYLDWRTQPEPFRVKHTGSGAYPITVDRLSTPTPVHPLIYLNRIEGVEAGLAILIRNRADASALREAISNAQQWEKLSDCSDELPLYRLMTGDACGLGRALHRY